MPTGRKGQRRKRERSGFALPGHDHALCIGVALAAAERQCAAKGARLTEQRRRVLELIWKSHAPVGAYTLLDRLREDGVRAQPPTVYRALEFLVDNGLIHRIESLNAYVGCAEPSQRHVGQFLICTDCRSAAELDDPGIGTAIAERAAAIGFAVSRATIEIAGLCPNCRQRR
jgi:Fur family zinc uptake transcriptional regulator